MPTSYESVYVCMYTHQRLCASAQSDQSSMGGSMGSQGSNVSSGGKLKTLT